MKTIINTCQNCQCIAIIAILSVVLILTGVPVSQGAEIDQSKWTELKRTVNLPNTQILKYVELGDPKGPPVVLLHGYTDNSRSWSLVSPYLKSFRLFAIDQRGHGDSSKPECCYTLTDMAYDVKLFLDALKIERASVVGHSLGSMVVQVNDLRAALPTAQFKAFAGLGHNLMWENPADVGGAIASFLTK